MKKLWGLAAGFGLAVVFFTACSAGEDGSAPVYKYFGYMTNPGGMDRDGDPLPPGTISAFAIDPGSGGFTVLAGSPFPSVWRAYAIAAHPSGRFLYVSGKQRPSDINEYWISVLTIDPATGALTRTADPVHGVGYSPAAAAVHPSGKFIYFTDKQSFGGGGDSQVSGFTIDEATGELTRMAGSPFEVEYIIGKIAVDPSGKFAYMTRYDDDCISALTIDPVTGALTAMVGSPFAAGDGPWGMAISPSGTFAYVGNSGSISAFTIDAATGALAEVPGSPYATHDDPTSIIIYPTGKFVYAVNAGSDCISVFAVDPATGALAEVAGSPFLTSGNISSIVVDPSGMFAYLPDYDPSVHAFKIDPATGRLTELAGSPFVVGVAAPWAPTGGHYLAVVRIAQ